MLDRRLMIRGIGEVGGNGKGEGGAERERERDTAETIRNGNVHNGPSRACPGEGGREGEGEGERDRTFLINTLLSLRDLLNRPRSLNEREKERENVPNKPCLSQRSIE
jgi:hypothetical protein